MQWAFMIVVVALTFGGCYLLDKGFTKAFRGTAQHKTGLQVRLNKRYGVIGVLVLLLGLAALITGRLHLAMVIASIILIIMGTALIVYYLSFGVYYDSESFVLSAFGKKSKLYSFREIRAQQLYNSYGSVIIELHMLDGRALQLHASMEGVYPFMDKAFAGWLRQQGKQLEDCPFHDPANSCWFPPLEV